MQTVFFLERRSNRHRIGQNLHMINETVSYSLYYSITQIDAHCPPARATSQLGQIAIPRRFRTTKMSSTYVTESSWV